MSETEAPIGLMVDAILKALPEDLLIEVRMYIDDERRCRLSIQRFATRDMVDILWFQSQPGFDVYLGVSDLDKEGIIETVSTWDHAVQRAVELLKK